MELFLVGIGIVVIVNIFAYMFEARVNNPHPELVKKSHRHPENKRRSRKEGDVKGQMDYFQQLKSSTAESVRGYNAELQKSVKG